MTEVREKHLPLVIPSVYSVGDEMNSKADQELLDILLLAEGDFCR